MKVRAERRTKIECLGRRKTCSYVIYIVGRNYQVYSVFENMCKIVVSIRASYMQLRK